MFPEDPPVQGRGLGEVGRDPGPRDPVAYRGLVEVEERALVGEPEPHVVVVADLELGTPEARGQVRGTASHDCRRDDRVVQEHLESKLGIRAEVAQAEGPQIVPISVHPQSVCAHGDSARRPL
jgi:hypothetical protein